MAEIGASVESKLLVIGVGNRYRRDDGVGPLLTERLRQLGPDELRVIEHSGEFTSLMELIRGAESVIIVDAVDSGASPGTIHRFDPTNEIMPRELFHTSTHTAGVAEAVELMRAIGQLPRRLKIYGIEAGDVSPGMGLSAEVDRAADEVKELIAADLVAPCTNNH